MTLKSKIDLPNKSPPHCCNYSWDLYNKSSLQSDDRSLLLDYGASFYFCESTLTRFQGKRRFQMNELWSTCRMAIWIVSVEDKRPHRSLRRFKSWGFHYVPSVFTTRFLFRGNHPMLTSFCYWFSPSPILQDTQCTFLPKFGRSFLYTFFIKIPQCNIRSLPRFNKRGARAVIHFIREYVFHSPQIVF